METSMQESELYEERFGFKERRSNFRFYVFLLFVLFLLLGFRLWWTAKFFGVLVDGSSMVNTLRHGDKLLAQRLENADELARGSIIIVDVSGYEECKGVKDGLLIKRLIAKEGDKVRCTDGQIEIWYAGADGYVPLDEPYAYYENKYAYDFAEYTVGEGEIFFLGDNRNNSKDSRYYDYLKEGSNLKDRLYKSADVCGVVTEWAVKHREILGSILFIE